MSVKFWPARKLALFVERVTTVGATEASEGGVEKGPKPATWSRVTTRVALTTIAMVALVRVSVDARWRAGTERPNVGTRYRVSL